jgi:hypothetical protein
MLRCTCCGRWTVEAVTLVRDRRHTFYRVRRDGVMWDEYLTTAALETELTEQGVFEYLAEVSEAA